MSTSGFNQLILVGTLGADPQLAYLKGGKAVCKAILVCSDQMQNDEGEWVEQKSHFSIQFFQEEAERLHQTCRKGALILIEGKIYQGHSKQGRSQLLIQAQDFRCLVDGTKKTDLWPEASKSLGKNNPLLSLTQKKTE